MSHPLAKAAGGLTLVALLLSATACSSGGGPGISLAMQNPGETSTTPPSDPGVNVDPNNGSGAGDLTNVSNNGGGGSGGGGGAGQSGCATCAPNGPTTGGGLIRDTLDVATNLLTAGNADLTGGLLGQARIGVLEPTLGVVETVANPVTQIAIANNSVLGNATGSPLVGLSALSNGQVNGTLATLGVLNSGGAIVDASLGNTASTLGAVAPAAINLGGNVVVGGAGVGTSLVAANVGGGNATGQLASANVLSGGATTLAGLGGALANPTNLVDLNLGGTQVLGSGGAAVSVGVGAAAAPASVAGVGVLSGGQTGGMAGTVVNGTVGTVNGLVGGLLKH